MPGKNPEEGCQIRDGRLHDKDTWLCDSYAGQPGMGHIADKKAEQQTLHAIKIDHQLVDVKKENNLQSGDSRPLGGHKFYQERTTSEV